MKHLYMYGSVAIAAALVGCVDEDYDLSDIDTMVRVSVSNLVVPINIDQIELKTVLDIDDDDEHIKVIGGEYCYVTDGTFSSDAINVPRISVKIPSINSVSLSVGSGQSTAITIPSGGIDVSAPILGSSTSLLSLNASSIDASIVTIDNVGADMGLTLNLECGSAVQSAASKLTITGMQIQLPAGLKASSVSHGSYDATTGILTIPELVCITSQTTSIRLQFSGINVGDKFDASRHSFDYSSQVGILAEGSLSIAASDMFVGATLPTNIELSLGFVASDFVAATFTGQICYKIDDISVPDVNLGDLPDIISQSGSNLVLNNPQLYIQANNPLNNYGLKATSGMKIQAMRDAEATVLMPDELITFVTNSTGQCNILLAPNYVSPDSEFATDLSYVSFSSLGSILSGNGVPDFLKISLVDPQVPTQQVGEFELGQNYDGINGKYKFVAPLQLEAGSIICYRDTVDGWSSEDLEAITITDLTVNFDVTTDVPVAVSLTGYPINENGKQINGVTINGANIPANAQNQSVSITVSGSISNLDGIVFEANATAVGGNALSPNMTVTLSNIRPMVSGYYEKEL